MESSIFNVRVPLPDRDEVFLMNTFSDAQLLASPDVATLLDRVAAGTETFADEERETLRVLTEHGFLVASRAQEREALGKYFGELRESSEQLRVTVLTTLQCNFACDYCLQGDHDEHNRFGHKMSLATAQGVAAWVAERLDAVRPEKFVLTFFGGEPLLNLPVVYYLAETCHRLCTERGVPQALSIITNGLLLTPEVVDRLLPFGLMGAKITLDGDRDTHNRMRPLRGRQGTFDRIVENMRRVADRLPLTVGGNFDEQSWESYPALLDFLRDQAFAKAIVKVNFKPIIGTAPAAASKVIPLTAVGATGRPLNGACMSGAGAGAPRRPKAGACDTCQMVDEKMQFLREETRKRGFYTPDGVHMGPCEIHRRHAHTVGIDGALYACPGFGSEPSEAIGHVDPAAQPAPAIDRFDHLNPLKEACGDCSFIPVCGGGCSVAAHNEGGDLYAPSCHKGAFEAALVDLAKRTAAGESC
jgi:uncharacterized protein